MYIARNGAGFFRHQLRLADRAACSLATDEITGGEEQALIDGYRERLIKVAAVAIAALNLLSALCKKEPDHPIKKQNSRNGRLGVRIGGGKNEAIPTETQVQFLLSRGYVATTAIVGQIFRPSI